MKYKTRHHRKCRSNGGSDDLENLSVVDDAQHKAWHRLFRNMDAYRIVQKINMLYIDPDFVLQVKQKKRR